MKQTPMRCECGQVSIVTAEPGQRSFHLWECPRCHGRASLWVSARTGDIITGSAWTRKGLEWLERTPGLIEERFGCSFEEVAEFFSDPARAVQLERVGRP